MHAKSKFKSMTTTESAQGVQAICDPLPELEIEDLVEETEKPFIWFWTVSLIQEI